MQPLFEAFALRDHERVEIVEQQPTGGRFFAVMARSVSLPEGPRSEQRDLDGAPVEDAAIVAAQIQHEKSQWQWLQLAPLTKEFIGDLLFDNRFPKDRWYFARIIDLNVTVEGTA